MKLVSLLLILFFLSGCAIINPQPKQAVLPDQQAFCQAFDEFQKSQQVAGFQKLMVDFPDSIWTDRAATMILYSQQLDQLKAQNGQLRKSEHFRTLELERLGQQNQQLSDRAEQLDQLNRQLKDKIEQLKGLLISSEKYLQ